jgi:cytochrome c oxidase subunit 2
MPDRTLARTIVAAVLATAIGIFLGFEIHWFPVQGSSQARQVDTLYHVLIIATVPIFVLVVTVVLYSSWRFRMRAGEELKDGPPIHGNTRLEILWTVAPTVLILGMVSYSFVVLHDIEKKPAGKEMQVNVTGQQFAWSYEYPSSATGGAPVQTDQLYLPKGESVRFNLISKDVIHAFWVPAFRIQEDVVPGVTTHYRITPTRLGTYDVVCNELCGLGHAVMRSTVHVLTPAAFQTWLKSKQSSAGATAPATGSGASGGASGAAANGGGPAPSGAGGQAGGATTRKPGGKAAAGASAALGPITDPGTGASAGNAALVAQGRQVFAGDSGCSGCHTLADAHSTGQIGPNLNTALTGAKHSAGFIATSIVKPNSFVEKGFPSSVMPASFGSTLSKRQIAALVSYLEKATGP